MLRPLSNKSYKWIDNGLITSNTVNKVIMLMSHARKAIMMALEQFRPQKHHLYQKTTFALMAIIAKAQASAEMPASLPDGQ